MIINGKCQNCGARDQRSECSYCQPMKTTRADGFMVITAEGPVDIADFYRRGLITAEEFRAMILETR